MRRQHVDSSAVSSVGYDERSSVLEVEFSSGAVYDYYDVPPKVYRDLLKASSIGNFVSRRVRDRYACVRRDH
jgi:KTSC domain-containing protein